ncbi:unnamed protein product [Durusdinium trenchii]|uniref:Ig-like domain-containing protein n=1 Tax=Durusdinium trenchii TaxID=1381693 RepID=A0ABP0NQZ5_9DINO
MYSSRTCWLVLAAFAEAGYIQVDSKGGIAQDHGLPKPAHLKHRSAARVHSSAHGHGSPHGHGSLHGHSSAHGHGSLHGHSYAHGHGSAHAHTKHHGHHHAGAKLKGSAEMGEGVEKTKKEQRNVVPIGSLQELKAVSKADPWVGADWPQKKANSSQYAIGEDTCQEWDCAGGTACRNSIASGVCFEAKTKGSDIQFDWKLTEPLRQNRRLRFNVEQFQCGNGMGDGHTELNSYDAKGGELVCSYSMPDQKSYKELELVACKDASYLYFRTTHCEGLPRFTTITWVS